MKNTKTNDTPIVSINRDTYEKIDLTTLLSPLGGLKKYIKKGEQVLLKTNLLNASTPEKNVVTNPQLVKVAALEVKKVGGEPIIGDSPSREFTKRRLEKAYKKSGLLDISKEHDIELNYDTTSKKIQIPNGKKIQKVSIGNFYLNADKTIALPKIKTHSLMMMTLASKIMYGVVPGLTKVRYHSQFIKKEPFADMLLDLLSITTPDLIIMDGIIGMQGNGPSGGEPAEIGLLLASENPIAMDLAICEILNIEPVGIPVLKQAKIRKLWPKDIKYPILKPTDVKIKDFELPTTAGHLLTGEKQPAKSPVITDKCVACGDCMKICPRKAITIDKKAIVDYKKCIRCYCCHEVCTYDAIKLESI